MSAFLDACHYTCLLGLIKQEMIVNCVSSFVTKTFMSTHLSALKKKHSAWSETSRIVDISVVNWCCSTNILISCTRNELASLAHLFRLSHVLETSAHV